MWCWITPRLNLNNVWYADCCRVVRMVMSHVDVKFTLIDVSLGSSRVDCRNLRVAWGWGRRRGLLKPESPIARESSIASHLQQRPLECNALPEHPQFGLDPRCRGGALLAHHLEGLARCTWCWSSFFEEREEQQHPITLRGWLPLSTQFIHIIFPQNISRYRVGELYLINLPQNFSRHAPVTKKTIHWSGMSIQPSGQFGL